MIQLLACLFVTFQGPNEETVWQAISRLETFIQKEVNQVKTHGMVLPSDPVRGYYFQGQGIIFFVPIRYRTQGVRTVDLEFPNSAQMMKSKDQKTGGWNQQVRDWKNQLKKREATKDAAFGEVLQALSNCLPDLVVGLPRLPAQEALILVLEEREPAWVFGSFGPSAQFKRKITTLRIENLSVLREKTFTAKTLSPYISKKTDERPASLSHQRKTWGDAAQTGLK